MPDAPARRPIHGESWGDAHEFAVSLGPPLADQLDGRLTALEWFRSTWQHGGAATAFARWRGDDEQDIPVLVKLPVGENELRWTALLGAVAPGSWNEREAQMRSTPRVLASGNRIGASEAAWLVVERLEGHPISASWDRQAVEDLLHAAADLHRRAGIACPTLGASEPTDWATALAHAKDAVREREIPEPHRWLEAIKHAQRVLPALAAQWEKREINCWCHGDLHGGNALRRNVPGRGGEEPCVLIDLALVHAGHWIEDAVYLERQFWARPDGLHGVKPLSFIAQRRRELGLPTEGDYSHLANVRRVLMAACAPLSFGREGGARYVHAALDMLESRLPQASHERTP